MTQLVMHTSNTEMPDMLTTQQESDCHMMHMAKHMDGKFTQDGVKGTIVMYGTDTDVLVLACYHTSHFQNALVFWETGTTTKYENTHRFVPVHEIVKCQCECMMSILPHIHALS